MTRPVPRLVAALLAVSAFLPACTARQPDCTDPDIVCVGLVTNPDGLDDRAYNQAAWEGLQLAQSDRLVSWTQVIETRDSRDYAKNIAAFVEMGYDIIVTAGSGMADATGTAAGKYPAIHFIGIDQFQDWSLDEDPANDLPNLSGLVFHEEQGGFLMGALAALVTETGTVGAVCSTSASLPVWRYCEGFRAGAIYIDRKIVVEFAYHDDADMATAFSDPAWGASAASSLINGGVDLLFGVGGETGESALTTAARLGGSGLGSDFDQYARLMEASPRLLSSAVKGVTPGLRDLLGLAVTALDEGAPLPAGNYYGLMEIAPFHDLEANIPGEVGARLEEIRLALQDGELLVNLPSDRP
ncbi:MAG: BMP family ABC transporter substrate-binding protein [Chloroflexi bacterium]|nr:BMP family ABC transporter substrate-binding protein [Chloroflexota bacterium]